MTALNASVAGHPSTVGACCSPGCAKLIRRAPVWRGFGISGLSWRGLSDGRCKRGEKRHQATQHDIPHWSELSHDTDPPPFASTNTRRDVMSVIVGPIKGVGARPGEPHHLVRERGSSRDDGTAMAHACAMYMAAAAGLHIVRPLSELAKMPGICGGQVSRTVLRCSSHIRSARMSASCGSRGVKTTHRHAEIAP